MEACGMTPGMYGTIGATIGCIILAGLWQYERAEKMAALNDVTALRGNISKLETSLQTEKDTVAGMLKLADGQNALIGDMESRNNEIQNSVNAALAENRELRASEEQKALEMPFLRGNAATARINRRLCLFAGREDCGSTYDSSNAGADDS